MLALRTTLLQCLDLLFKFILSRIVCVDLFTYLYGFQLFDPLGELFDRHRLSADAVVDEPLSEALVATFAVPSEIRRIFHLLEVLEFIAMVMACTQACLNRCVPLLHAVLEIVESCYLTKIGEVFSLLTQDERQLT